LLFTTVGFLHIKIVAELGTSAVAAVTTGHRIFFLVQAILMGVSVAATAMIARAWGAQQVRQAEVISWTSIVLAVGIAAVLSIPVLTVPHGLASLFGLDAETTDMAAKFIFWLGLFNVFSAISMMLSTALRAIGDVITPLWFLFFSSLVNIALAWLLAYGIGPFPNMGIEGVALGGSFGASVVTLIFAFIWWRGKFNLKPIAGAKIEWPMMKQPSRIGAPSAIEQGIIQLAFLAFFAVIAQYGTEAFAAYGIGISLVAFSIVIGFGFGIATATLVGQHLGAGQPEQALLAVSRSLRMAVVAMVVLSILLAVYAEPLARFMIKDDEVVNLTVIFIYFIAFAQPLMAFEFTLGGALRGAGDTRSPLIATFCGIILGRLIPALIFLWMGLSVYWIFAVMLFDYVIKTVILIYRYRSRHWLDVKFGT
jgi:putative MATE family efflux protein